jgi:hypothetical protein
MDLQILAFASYSKILKKITYIAIHGTYILFLKTHIDHAWNIHFMFGKCMDMCVKI